MGTWWRRIVSVLAGAAMVAVVATGSAPGAPAARSTPAAPALAFPDAESLDAFRGTLRSLLATPTNLRLQLSEGQFRSRGVTYAFDLTAERNARAATLTLALRPPRGGGTLTARAVAVPGPDDAVRLDLDLAGPRGALEALWPDVAPMPSALALRSRVDLVRGGVVTAAGRLTLGDAGATPVALDYSSRYDARAGRLEATATAADTAGRLDGRLVYAPVSGAYDAEVALTSLDLGAAGVRLGLARVPPALVIGDMRGRVSGVLRAADATARAEVQARGLRAAPLAAPVDATLGAAATLARGSDGFALASLERAILTLGPERQPIALVTASSVGDRAWPVRLDVRTDDLGRLAPLIGPDMALAGSAQLRGDVGGIAPLVFAGRVEGRVDWARLPLGEAATMINATAALPVRWGAGEDEPGRVFVERLEVFDVTVNRLVSSARLLDGRLLLPDLGYVHYGGQGSGWLEAAVDGRAVPFRSRVEGRRVNLAGLVADVAKSIGQASGRVGYVATAQYGVDTGLAALVQVRSEEGGGEINIEALQRMLESPAVQVESTGLVKQTLTNLRSFEYETLGGELRYEQGAGRIDLSLRGKKRFGIFPAPVEAINIRNMPLAMLARAFQGGTPR